MTTLLISVEQIVTMFTFILVGYLLRKKNIVPQNAGKTISTVLVNVCIPAMIFLSCASNMTVDKLASGGKIVLCGAIILAIAYVASVFLATLFSKDKFERDVYAYSFTIPNIGSMGAPLAEAVFGGEVLFNTIVFTFPMYLFIYSKGMQMLSPGSPKGLRHVLLQPNIIALTAGILFGLVGWPMPSLVENITSTVSACVGPLAMILTGCVMAERKLSALLGDIRVYIASAIRLLAIPFVAIGIMLALRVPSATILAAASMLAMPMGLNTVVFPEAYGGDGSKGASLALISHTMSLATIPFVFWFLGTLM